MHSREVTKINNTLAFKKSQKLMINKSVQIGVSDNLLIENPNLVNTANVKKIKELPDQSELNVRFLLT